MADTGGLSLTPMDTCLLCGAPIRLIELYDVADGQRAPTPSVVRTICASSRPHRVVVEHRADGVTVRIGIRRQVS